MKDDTPKLHRLLLKRCALGDKEAFAAIMGMYYELDPWDRESFLARVITESDKTRKALKNLELLALEDREAQLADAEEEDVRGEEPGVDREEDGGGGCAVGA